MKQIIKRALLPPPGPRTLRFGIARGVRMKIDFQHHTRTYLGLYEVELNRYLRAMLKPGMTAFDVGGQHGYDALVIAKHTSAAVFSFECDSECLQGMAETVDLNPELGRLITPMHAMVGQAEGELGLDEFAYGAGLVPDFIKLDIEGAELSALRSATRILSEHHPALVVEVHSAQLERDCGRLLVEHAYKPRIVNQRSLWPDHRPTVETNRWLVAS